MSAAVDDLICAVVSAWSASAVRGPAWCLRQIEDDYKAEMREAIHVLHNAGSLDITNDGDVVRLIEGRRG